MARIEWFSDEGDDLFFNRYVERMESWQQALADGVVTLEEIKAQAERVADLLRKVEPMLNDEQHEAVTELLLEMAVLNALQSAYLLQNATQPTPQPSA